MDPAENEDLNLNESEIALDEEIDDADTASEDNDEEDDQDSDESEGNTDAAPAGETQQPSRATRRFQKLEKERDEAIQRERELSTRLLEVTKAQSQHPDQSEAARRAEADRIAAMDPNERERYLDKQELAALKAQVNGLGFSQKDGLDKARFEAKAEVDPIYKKYASAVEKTLQDMRAQGVDTTREAILTYKVGEAALKRKSEKDSVKLQDANKRAAKTRVASVEGRSSNSRGDSSGTSRGKTEEDRLRGMQI